MKKIALIGLLILIVALVGCTSTTELPYKDSGDEQPTDAADYIDVSEDNVVDTDNLPVDEAAESELTEASDLDSELEDEDLDNLDSELDDVINW